MNRFIGVSPCKVLLGVALGPEPVGFHAGHYGGAAMESIEISGITYLTHPSYAPSNQAGGTSFVSVFPIINIEAHA
jgi:hypothetical protein